MTTFDFGSGKVPAHQHKNPDGSIGGWVADTAFVAATAFVADTAHVSGDARVFGNACVCEHAWVSGDLGPISDQEEALIWSHLSQS